MSPASRRFLTSLRVGLLAALALAVVVSSLTHRTTSGGSPSGFRGPPVDTSHGFQLGQDNEPGSGIVGNVSIVNRLLMCAARANPDGTLVPRPDVNTELIITEPSGEEILVPVSWYEIFNCGSVVGSFKTSLLSGSYFITLSYCSENSTKAGCDHLPVMVSVGHRGMTQVILDIELGWVAQGNLVVMAWQMTLRVFPPAT